MAGRVPDLADSQKRPALRRDSRRPPKRVGAGSPTDMSSGTGGHRLSIRLADTAIPEEKQSPTVRKATTGFGGGMFSCTRAERQR